MNKLILILIILIINIMCYTINIKDKLPRIVLKNQFNIEKEISLNTEIIIMTFDRDTSNIVIDFIEERKEFLSKNKIVYINSPLFRNMKILTNGFLNYKMKHLNFDVLLLNDTYIKLFEEKKEFITIYEIKYHVVTNLIYLKTKEDLEKFFN